MQILKLLMESKGFNVEWSPDSNDLTLELATRCVPVRLYNFLAWYLGYSCDPIEDKWLMSALVRIGKWYL